MAAFLFDRCLEWSVAHPGWDEGGYGVADDELPMTDAAGVIGETWGSIRRIVVVEKGLHGTFRWGQWFAARSAPQPFKQRSRIGHRLGRPRTGEPRQWA